MALLESLSMQVLPNISIKDRLTAAEPAKAKLVLAPAPEKRLLNRELSLVEFFRQVLDEARDERNPLLERLRFLTILSSIVDEFFMVRVSGLKEEVEHGWHEPSHDGMTAPEQLAEIRKRLEPMVAEQIRCLREDILPALKREGIVVAPYDALTKKERAQADNFFTREVFPVLTPLAVDPAHPFPYISGLSLNLAVVVRDPDSGPELFARIKVPANVPRFVSVNAAVRSGVDSGARGVCFLPMEELIAAHLGQLFSGMQIIEHHVFRVTRNADVEVDDDRDEDLLQALERELARRRFGPPVRLEVASTISDHVLDLLVRELDMDDEHVIRVPGLLDLSSLWQVHEEVDRPDL